ncbi:MAG: class I SAM-dependent methyltransferase [Bacteroidota bacterium]
MKPEENKADKAGESYWTHFWQQLPFPTPIDVSRKVAGSYVHRKLDEHFNFVFSNLNPPELDLLEIGCGNSAYLSFFHHRYGFRVHGIDYSSYGCQRTREILKQDEVAGNIMHGDLFEPPQELLGRFDVVCSFGVAEHFENTSDVILRMSDFVKPGGLLITTIPNLSGPTGLIQKYFNRPVYDIHRVMNLGDLKQHIQKAGLEIVLASRFVPISFGVTLEEIDGKQVRYKGLKRFLLKGLQVIEKIMCRVDDHLIALPKTDFWCAGFIVTARKPTEPLA